MVPYRKINSLSDITDAAYVIYGRKIDPVISSVIGMLDCRHKVLNGNEEAFDYLASRNPDIVFTGSSADEEGGPYSLCRTMRQKGYRGIFVLIAGEALDWGATAGITSEGFDNYILGSDSADRIKDSIYWAILNRKRRNKYTIQFDFSPDAFCTVDREGNVYDINRTATEGTDFVPRDVVKSGINLSQLGTMGSFQSNIQPLITPENVGKVFTHTEDEVGEVRQVKVTVHNMPTLGLVATIVGTDITKAMYSRAMDILVNSITMLSQRDNYTAEHSARVFYYCTHIARELGCAKAKKFLRSLYFAALLHDIGKVGIKDEVLLKPGKLTPLEYAELSTHPARGCEILRPFKFLRESIDFVRSHHERPDGRGYPDCLRDNKIAFGSSIIAVADGFDAMTSNRPYRNSLSFDIALSEIKQNMGAQFDEEASKAFLSVATPLMVEKVRTDANKPLGDVSQELIEEVVR